MNSHQHSIKGLNSTISILTLIVGLVLTYYFSNLYLENNFPYAGEAYMKGAGHLLSEDFTKAIIFLLSRHLVASAFLFSLVFLLSIPVHRVTLFRIFNSVALTALSIIIIYTVYKLFDISSNGYYDQLNRVIEISLTWILRIAGMYIANFLTKPKNSQATIQVS